MAKSDPVLSAIARLGAGSRRSALARHMRRNFDAIAAEIGEARADWAAWATAFNEGGVTVRGGKPVRANTARVTWQRVKAEVLAQRARRAAVQTQRPAGAVQAPGEVVPGVRLVEPGPHPPSSPSVEPPFAVPVAYPPSPRIEMPKRRPLIDLGPAIAKPPSKQGE